MSFCHNSSRCDEKRRCSHSMDAAKACSAFPVFLKSVISEITLRISNVGRTLYHFGSVLCERQYKITKKI